jgi:hypothetical protein
VLAFVLQLALNLAWSPVFFGAHQIRIALMILGALDLAVLLTLVLFWKVRRSAALLLLPYFGGSFSRRCSTAVPRAESGQGRRRGLQTRCSGSSFSLRMPGPGTR